MEQLLIYKMDLTKIQGIGDFQCPKCGVAISPDDETNEFYCILEAAVKDNNLEELLIQCQNCKSKIRLTGFSILNNVSNE